VVRRAAKLVLMPLTWLLVFLVRAYQFGISPLLAGACRFVPSCSDYAVQALQRHGPFKGSWLAVRRVLRCRPGRPGGYDPVP
jgi:putative membrane protein insertion efficiency factor